MITRTLESAPKNATHWSTRSMAQEVGLSQTAVSRIWRAFGLQPHRQETWKLSKDPLFVDKVRDVVGLCLNPPERAVVLCVDDSNPSNATAQPLLTHDTRGMRAPASPPPTAGSTPQRRGCAAALRGDPATGYTVVPCIG